MLHMLLVLVLVLVLGSMGWLTARAGRAHRQVMVQAQQEAPRLVEQAKAVRSRAQERRDQCEELVTTL